MKHCLYCNEPIVNLENKRRFRKDKKFCSKKCHDSYKYQKASKQVREFKDKYGLDKYTIKGLDKKVQLIELFGGKCEICGYNKNIAAFDFHHKDGYEKSFEIKIAILKWKTDSEILEEASKCMLLCSNCHRELHNPHLNTEHVKRVLSLK